MRVQFNKHVKKVGCMILILVMLLTTMPLEHIVANAASSYTVKFKILATSDIHGAVVSKNPETGLAINEAGFDKVATLIKKQRDAVGAANTLLIDNGDFLFDYSSDYIYDHYNKDTQPILKAMSLMKYDAINLGNHEFDYPDSYLKKQLKSVGLYDKIVSSNLYNKETNKSVYAPSKVITKTVKTTNGKKIKVKVGVIAATRPLLPNRRQLHVDTKVAKAVVSSVKTQVSKLKKEGAQVIVVATHGGLGNANAKSSDTNVAYAISKIKGVDAIIAGHTHEIFPSDKFNTRGLSGINKKTGKVNGVPMIIPGSNARGLGVIDMKLKVTSKGKVTSKSSSSSYKEVTSSTKANSTIKKYFTKYDSALNNERKQVVTTLDDSTILTNLDMVVKDTPIMQVVNDAKLSFAAEYLKTNYPAMSNAKIVAVTRLNSTGLNGSNDFVYAKGQLTKGQLAQIVSYKDHMVLVKITGKQLKEWMEFSASIYEKTYGTHASISYYEKLNSAHPLLASSSSQFAYWDNFYVFDGVTYEINLSQKPRYNATGSVISSSRRITNLKYNGVEVKDTDTFVVVSGYEGESFSFMPKEESKSTNLLYDEPDYISTNTVVQNYIKKTALTNNNKLKVEADRNWRLLIPTNYQFHLYGSKNATFASYIKKQAWYSGILFQKPDLAKTFYYGKLTEAEKGATLANGLIISSTTAATSKPVQLSVLGNGSQRVTSVSWVPGVVTTPDHAAWNNSTTASTYTVKTNGVYSAKITFASGSVLCKTYRVTNINPNYIIPPTNSAKITNRTNEVKGVAEPYSTVTLNDNNGHIYKAKADAKGNYKISIVYPINYLKKVTMQASKKIGGVVRYSSKVSVTIIKSGPNAATVKKVKNKATSIKGTVESGTQVAVRYSGTVYIAKGMKSLYKSSSGYKKGTKIKEVKVTYGKDNSYKLYLPKGVKFKKGKEVKVYSYKKIKAENKVITGKVVTIKVK